jgi:flagellar basal body rod protein FlgB
MDVTIEAVRVGLDIAQLRTQVASINIARADLPGSRLYAADFSRALTELHRLVNASGDSESSKAVLAREALRAQVQVAPEGDATRGVTLDARVAELNLSAGQYRVLADAVSRRLALMQLAITGK